MKDQAEYRPGQPTHQEEPISVLPEIMDVQDLATIARVSNQTIKNCISDGKIPAYKIARGCWLISTKLLVRYIEKNSSANQYNSVQSSIEFKNG